MHFKKIYSITAAVCTVLFCYLAFADEVATPLPDGLFSSDSLARIGALKIVEQTVNKEAIGKVADMARNDAIADVRATACGVLFVLDAQEHRDLLKYLAVSDANAKVRAAAKKSLRRLRGDPEPEHGPMFTKESDEQSVEDDYEENKGPKIPTLMSNEPEKETRNFGFGFGSMGGFGLAAVNMRVKIPTAAKFLPWVGIELGGGWTPPSSYGVISGYLGEITDDDIQWKLISGAFGIQLYLHRLHYIPIRGGYDVGQGGYGLIGYGYEHLNDEGFFSWGVEVGLLYHPKVGKNIEKVASDKDQPEPWSLVPCVRFVMHFYLI